MKPVNNTALAIASFSLISELLNELTENGTLSLQQKKKVIEAAASKNLDIAETSASQANTEAARLLVELSKQA